MQKVRFGISRYETPFSTRPLTKPNDFCKIHSLRLKDYIVKDGDVLVIRHG